MSMTILVADDLDVNRKLLRTLLAAEGYDVTEAANGVDAYTTLQNATGPMVGLIDWEMPQMEGIEVCRKTRALRGSPPLYLILLTVRDSKQDIVKPQMVQLGVDPDEILPSTSAE